MALFLDPLFADDAGLVAVGGDLSPRTLVRAYSRGVFPWFDEGDPICWWSPDPRAIFDLEAFHVPKRLARTIRSGTFHCTINRDFHAVIRGCADRDQGTWITDAMIDAYTRLHELGVVHSVEAWNDDQLAGGIYGVALGGLFAGESMFTYIRDGSKIALVFLIEHLRAQGFTLFDVQMLTPHTHRLGAVEIPRAEYLSRLQYALRQKVKFVGTR